MTLVEVREYVMAVATTDARAVAEIVEEAMDVNPILDAIEEAGRRRDFAEVKRLTARLYRLEENVFDALSERFPTRWLHATEVGLAKLARVLVVYPEEEVA